MEKQIRFMKGGEVRMFSTALPLEQEPVSDTRRASYIEPFNPFLRFLFHLIRGPISDESRLAEFTRRWPCKWRANVFDHRVPNKVIGPFNSRQEAIDAEIKYITDHWIKEGLNADD